MRRSHRYKYLRPIIGYTGFFPRLKITPKDGMKQDMHFMKGSSE